MKEIRLQELFVLFYRIFLAFFFYQIARFLFWFFNKDLIRIDSVADYISISYHGFAFDTTAILYVNSLFILLSLIPIVINTKKYYQKFLFYLYFITNGIAYGMNFGDFIYYKFSQARLTTAALNVAKNENNIGKIFIVSILEHPFVIFWFAVLIMLWIFLYKKEKVTEFKPE